MSRLIKLLSQDGSPGTYGALILLSGVQMWVQNRILVKTNFYKLRTDNQKDTGGEQKCLKSSF